jgi:hypothetical protein
MGSPDPVSFASDENPSPDWHFWPAIKDHDPSSKSYTSFSGVDTRVMLRMGDKMKNLAATMAISYKKTSEGVRGTIITCLFDESSLPLLEQTDDIYICCANEFGCVAECKLEDVEIEEAMFGVAVDDIVMEEQFTFSAKKLHPFKKGKNTYSQYLMDQHNITPPKSTAQQASELYERWIND